MKEAVILIPSYEPDSLLVQVVEELLANDFPILLVNDGSGSEFDPIFDQVKGKVAYLAFEKNKGKGAAMKYGYSRLLEFYPEAKYVITVDGDGQHALPDIIRVYETLLEENHLVFGVRHFGKGVPLKSRIGNDMSKMTRSLLTKQYIQDDQCGLRGFPVRYIPELLKIAGNRYEYEMNQLATFQLMQVPIFTIPIETIYLDNNSRSHFSPLKDTLRIQGIILMHSIAALILNACIIASIILLRHFTPLPIIADVYLSYTGAFLIYFLFLSIRYPTKSFFRRLFKELFFVALKMESAHWLLLLMVGIAGMPMAIWAPIAVVLCAGLNILFSWMLRKIFPSF